MMSLLLRGSVGAADFCVCVVGITKYGYRYVFACLSLLELVIVGLHFLCLCIAFSVDLVCLFVYCAPQCIVSVLFVSGLRTDLALHTVWNEDREGVGWLVARQLLAWHPFFYG